MSRRTYIRLALSALPAMASWTPAWGSAATLAPSVSWSGAIQRNLSDQLFAWLDHAAPGSRPTIDTPAPDGKTALMAAAAAGDATLLARLLALGARPERVNTKGASALIYAAWGGNPTVVELLLRQRVPLDQAASNGWTAMTMAAAKGRAAVIRQLIAAGAAVDPPDVYGWTPLMRACNLGRETAVQLLHELGGASLEKINTSGQTALHVAAAAGQTAIYRWLLDHGADPLKRDFQQRTAADLADEAGRGKLP